MTKPPESARSAVPADEQPAAPIRAVGHAAVPRPVTGGQHYIRAGDYQASVTELGAGLRELTYRGRQLIAGYQPDELPPGGAGQLMLPWPNRVGGGRYDFCGASYQLDLSEPARGNAIHGLTRWANWEAAPSTLPARSRSLTCCSVVPAIRSVLSCRSATGWSRNLDCASRSPR
jgi:Aldose 1-epimerase